MDVLNTRDLQPGNYVERGLLYDNGEVTPTGQSVARLLQTYPGLTTRAAHLRDLCGYLALDLVVVMSVGWLDFRDQWNFGHGQDKTSVILDRVKAYRKARHFDQTKEELDFLLELGCDGLNIRLETYLEARALERDLLGEDAFGKLAEADDDLMRKWLIMAYLDRLWHRRGRMWESVVGGYRVRDIDRYEKVEVSSDWVIANRKNITPKHGGESFVVLSDVTSVTQEQIDAAVHSLKGSYQKIPAVLLEGVFA